MGGPSLGSKRLPGKQTQTEKGVNNANARRSRAFRAGLVRAMALLHDRFLQQVKEGNAHGEVATNDGEDGAPAKVNCKLSVITLADFTPMAWSWASLQKQ